MYVIPQNVAWYPDALNWHHMQVMASHIDGLVQEKRNSSVLAMELCFSCINPLVSLATELFVQWLLQASNNKYM